MRPNPLGKVTAALLMLTALNANPLDRLYFGGDISPRAKAAHSFGSSGMAPEDIRYDVTPLPSLKIGVEFTQFFNMEYGYYTFMNYENEKIELHAFTAVAVSKPLLWHLFKAEPSLYPFFEGGAGEVMSMGVGLIYDRSDIHFMLSYKSLGTTMIGGPNEDVEGVFLGIRYKPWEHY